MNWANTTLKDFQSALASSDPTPGGGSAAAVALGQAAALAKMVADLTLGNDKYSESPRCMTARHWRFRRRSARRCVRNARAIGVLNSINRGLNGVMEFSAICRSMPPR